MTKQKSVSVVIPAWNSERQLKDNVSAVLLAAKSVSAEVVIVDDASSDTSVAYLKSLGKKIKLYENATNRGFAATVNRGVALATGDIVILLNTDVRPSPDCFQNARKYFEDKHVYAVGFNSQEAWMGAEWKDGLFQHFRVTPTAGNEEKINPSAWASGGQAAFDRQKWNALGGMDSLYAPFYWEDTDMGYCAWKRGWQVLWAPDCKVEHLHAASVIAGSFTKAFVRNTAARNQFIFIWKNISDWTYLLNHLLYLPYYLLKYPRPVLEALWMLPRVFNKRQKECRFWIRSDRDILTQWVR